MSDAARPPIAQWHRGFALLAAVSLFIGTRALWTDAMLQRPILGMVITGCYAALLAAAVLVTTVSSLRLMMIIEAGILGIGIILVGCLFILHHRAADEGVFVARAAQAILHGEPIYGVHWPEIFEDPRVAVTKTMDGGFVDTYPYLPLVALMAAVVQIFIHSVVVAPIVSTAAIIIGTIVLWLLLPVPWRSAAVAIALGFGMLPTYAHRGYPAIVAVALLVPVAVGWASIGSGGRLGRWDVVRAVCLGAACAVQQLAWFVVPFLIVGVWSLRRGELPVREAARIVGGFIAIAAATFLLINLPFIAAGPLTWVAGIVGPLTQDAVPHGQGLVGISYYLLDGSGRLSFYSYAALFFAFALVGLSVLFMRRLGPAMLVLPWTIFFFATRSQDGYYVLMTPLWLASVATVSSGAFAGAWEPRAGLLGRARVRLGLALLLLAPVVACLVIAIASAPPLQMRVLHTVTIEGDPGIHEIDVRVTNTSTEKLRPHFAVSRDHSMSAYLQPVAGPDMLAPGQTADYRLVTSGAGAVPGPTGRLRLRAVTDDPVTLSSVDLPRTTPVVAPSPSP